ncbi:hydrogenase maturation nickel metallochaperone HypA [Bacillus sp. H-16]|uniref:hydrogenase maturation nickel metallochaperone HypA/HybF n=1 Tax=Alteribacter salitolerans TaxID=2912333 RepID=UPI0019639307|nr:hydrogenase maturation nickel metallochaperone HypA [Alteribacter salitolerans]MBM7096730.1 hydrogenase maturation nickel metallochaperone HypA [Alteribacter salitolerans]
MHEMSLMEDLIRLVSDDAEQRGIRHISKITVIVGDLSNVLPDALELAFLFMRTRELAVVNEETELEMVKEEARAVCRSCDYTFIPDYRIAFCPKCRLPRAIVVSGETFRVESYEGSDGYES